MGGPAISPRLLRAARGARGFCAAGLALLVAACSGSPSRPSSSPSVRLTLVPDGQAIVGVTRVDLRAEATGVVDGGAFRWSFGDGASADGQMVSHVYAEVGTYRVGVTVSDSSGPVASAGLAVVVRSLTGNWLRPGETAAGNTGFPIHLTQDGTTLSGSVSLFSLCPPFSGFRYPPGVVSGTLTTPRSVEWVLDCAGVRAFKGVVHPDLDSITGTYESAGPATYYRQ